MHEDHADTVLEIGLVTPARDAGRFVALVRERLAAHALAAPVYRIRLQADDLLALAGASGQLFPDAAHISGDWVKLIERLRARLGADSVQDCRRQRTPSGMRVADDNARNPHHAGRAPAAAAVALSCAACAQ
jgi:hypothetical protein